MRFDKKSLAPVLASLIAAGALGLGGVAVAQDSAGMSDDTMTSVQGDAGDNVSDQGVTDDEGASVDEYGSSDDSMTSVQGDAGDQTGDTMGDDAGDLSDDSGASVDEYGMSDDSMTSVEGDAGNNTGTGMSGDESMSSDGMDSDEDMLEDEEIGDDSGGF